MCTNLVASVQPTPPNLLELVASTMLEEVASSGNPSRQGLSEPVGVSILLLTIGNDATASENQSLATVDERSVRKSTGGSYDWAPPERAFHHCQKMFVADRLM